VLSEHRGTPPVFSPPQGFWCHSEVRARPGDVLVDGLAAVGRRVGVEGVGGCGRGLRVVEQTAS
jgi:hypothetical protein